MKLNKINKIIHWKIYPAELIKTRVMKFNLGKILNASHILSKINIIVNISKI